MRLKRHYSSFNCAGRVNFLFRATIEVSPTVRMASIPGCRQENLLNMPRGGTEKRRKVALRQHPLLRILLRSVLEFRGKTKMYRMLRKRKLNLKIVQKIWKKL